MVAHLDGCDDCREIVATVVQAQHQIVEWPPASPAPQGREAEAGRVVDRSTRRRAAYWALAIAVAAAAVLALFLGLSAAAPPTYGR